MEPRVGMQSFRRQLPQEPGPPGAAAHEAQVAGLRGQEQAQGFQVLGVVVRHEHHGAAGIQGQGGQHLGGVA